VGIKCFPRVPVLAARCNLLPLKLARRVVAISCHDASAAQPHMGPWDSPTAVPPSHARTGFGTMPSGALSGICGPRFDVQEGRFDLRTTPRLAVASSNGARMMAIGFHMLNHSNCVSSAGGLSQRGLRMVLASS
jgi:hypothetical protein